MVRSSDQYNVHTGFPTHLLKTCKEKYRKTITHFDTDVDRLVSLQSNLKNHPKSQDVRAIKVIEKAVIRHHHTKDGGIGATWL